MCRNGPPFFPVVSSYKSNKLRWFDQWNSFRSFHSRHAHPSIQYPQYLSQTHGQGMWFHVMLSRLFWHLCCELRRFQVLREPGFGIFMLITTSQTRCKIRHEIDTVQWLAISTSYHRYISSKHKLFQCHQFMRQSFPCKTLFEPFINGKWHLEQHLNFTSPLQRFCLDPKTEFNLWNTSLSNPAVLASMIH